MIFSVLTYPRKTFENLQEMSHQITVMRSKLGKQSVQASKTLVRSNQWRKDTLSANEKNFCIVYIGYQTTYLVTQTVPKQIPHA